MPTVKIAKGLNLFYRKSGTGDRILLLVHGNNATSLWWERVMGLLPEGITAYAPDLRQCGDSDHPGGEWSMADLADDIYQFTQAVGIKRATVVGHSLGGGIVQQLTVDHPELVERMVMVNSAEPAGLVTPPDRYAQLAYAITQPQILKMALGAMMPSAPKDEFYERVLEESAAKSATALIPNGHALDNMNLVKEVAGIKVPVLILYGQQDQLITMEMMQRANQQIPGSVLECWPKVGHSAIVEDPERFTKRLLAFMGL